MGLEATNDDAVLLAEDIMRRGLAFLMDRLIVSYGEEKEKLKAEMVAYNVTSLAYDYDYLRESDVDPSAARSSLVGIMSDDLIENVMEGYEYLKDMAPGLLILLRPDFLRVATMYPYHRLSIRDPLMAPQSMCMDKRENFKNLFNVSQVAGDNTNLRAARIDLFEMLCGERGGPWRTDFSADASTFRILHAKAFLYCKTGLTPASGVKQKAPLAYLSDRPRFGYRYHVLDSSSSAPMTSISALNAFNGTSSGSEDVDMGTTPSSQ